MVGGAVLDGRSEVVVNGGWLMRGGGKSGRAEGRLSVLQRTILLYYVCFNSVAMIGFWSAWISVSQVLHVSHYF